MILRLSWLIFFLPINAYAIDIEHYFGEWCVTSAERYRGGLTTDSQAKLKVGTKLILSEQMFKQPDKTIVSPTLKIASQKIETEEGIVPQKNSVFYGIFPDRTSVDSIQVYESSTEKYFWTELEIINRNSLMELFDGHFYVYEKCA